MIIGLGVVVLLGIILAVYALSFPSKTKYKTKKPQKPAKLSIMRYEENKPDQQPADSLIEEFEKLKSDYSQKEQELSDLKIKQAGFQAELAKRDEWIVNSEEAVKKSKEKTDEFEKKFIIKEQQIQNEFSKNVTLGREKNELSAELERQVKENKAISEENRQMKYRIENLIKENKDRLGAIEAFKKQQENSQWVSKQDFIKLNEEYTKIEKELDDKDNKIKSLTREISEIRSKDVAHLPYPESLPPEEKPAKPKEDKDEAG